jgi:hypothetical protein
MLRIECLLFERYSEHGVEEKGDYNFYKCRSGNGHFYSQYGIK